MKLRIKGNSLRLRVAPSEVARLLQAGRIEETIRFAQEEGAKLTYAVEHTAAEREISMRYRPSEVAVLLPTVAARRWAESESVGIYADLDVGGSKLAIAVEKDLACLHGDERDNVDTYPNPHSGIAC